MIIMLFQLNNISGENTLNNFNIFVPTAFTPDNDGINDIFIPVSSSINPNKYQLIIYDRGGNIVFETTSLTEGWNGSLKNNFNNLCPAGTYIWRIYATSLYSNESIEQVGVVNLIR